MGYQQSTDLDTERLSRPVLDGREIEERLGASPGGYVSLVGYQSRPEADAVILVLLVVCGLGAAMGLWGTVIAPPSVYALAMLVGSLAVGAMLARSQRPRWQVRMGADGILLADRRGRTELCLWADLVDVRMEAQSAQEPTRCHCLVLRDQRVYLLVATTSPTVMSALFHVLRSRQRGALVPGMAGAQVVVPQAALSTTGQAASLDDSRALSPADPPDQLTESEDA